jgi:four helix bundle protein
MSEEKGLETLQVWQKAKAFTLKVQSELVPAFPPVENWAMGTQLRRSVQSIPGNITEGYERYYDQEYIHFCTIARGSLEASFTYHSLANRHGFTSPNIFQTIENDLGSSHMIKEDFLAYYSDINQNDPLS